MASLLNRKSAKQCKARWHEWLDPSVRKVEWSREEEEKLLHLAKLMPAQWKTIGPLVGRTATQCQEHYEKLLDEAAAAVSGGGNDDAADTENVRAQPLRVGQIDSHPESKPARPDPIDMDEDEIEMLQEARARLANTQGKKAKRKAREKMLEQAKRLSELQKRRELKQAGLLSSQAKKQARRKNKDIDLGVEIPFHKPAPAGFHDVSGEASRSETLRQEKLKSVNFKKINEQQYRSRDREAAQAKKREEARLRTLERSNMQYVVAEVSKKNDPLNIRKRGPLDLPEPSVTDQELKQMAKMESAASALPYTAGGSDVTQTLLADYSSRPLPTPMRTPMTASGSVVAELSKQESIRRQASNLRMLERGQTPLLAGDADEVEEEELLDDEGDQKPAALSIARAGAVASARAQTPRRDHYGLNRPQSELRGGGAAAAAVMDDSASVGASTFATSAMSIREIAREERRATKRARRDLEAALAALPAPQFEYELEAPMDVDDAENQVVETVMMDEDAADVEAAERRRLQLEAETLYEARSSVVKRKDLPRPVGVIPETVYVSDDAVERMIDDERWMLLRHDAHAFPVDVPAFLGDEKKKKKKKDKTAMTPQDEFPPETPLEPIPEQFLNEAKMLIMTEMDELLESHAEKLLTDTTSIARAKELLLAETAKCSQAPKSESVFTSTGHVPVTQEAERASVELEFDTLQDATLALLKKNDKTESKLAVLTGGHAKRAQGIHVDLLHLHADLQNAVIEHAVYRQLQSQEEQGAIRRMDDMRERIRRLQQDEAELYAVYQQELMMHQRRQQQRDVTEGVEAA